MNIAVATTEFVTESNFYGGLANYTFKLATWLVKNNHTVTVFVSSDNDSGISQYEGITLVKVKLEDARWFYKYKFERWKLTFLMRKRKYYRIYFENLSQTMNLSILLKHSINKFDIIHYPNNGGMVYNCPKSIPSVVRLSGLTVRSHQFGGYGNSDLSIAEQEKFEMKGLKKANAVFCPSKMTIEYTKKIVFRDYHLIETPFNDSNLELDNSQYLSQLKNVKYLLFFGSIGLIKGVGTIAEMIFDLLEQHPDLHFVFVGKKLNNQIENVPVWDHLIAKAKQHSQRVIHIEPLRHAQLFPIIQHAECVVLPSRIDNFPNTCIEAMANSKIVIGTVGNGFDQLIEDGKNGYLINVDDHQQLLEKINLALSLPAYDKKKMEEAAKSRTDLLHPDIVLNQVLDLYKATIANFKN